MKGDTAHALRTQLSLLRNTIRNTHNALLKQRLRREETALAAKLEIAKRNTRAQ